MKGKVVALAELTQQTSKMLDEQEESIKALELNSEQVVGHLEEGNAEVQKATEHTRSKISKKRWALFIAGMSIPLNYHLSKLNYIKVAIVIALAVILFAYIKTRN
jgi:t-SNARE complex subunit (syntaxin)